MSVMSERSGMPSTNVDKMYDKFSKTSPKAVFEREKWNRSFPVPPLVSVGSAEWALMNRTFSAWKVSFYGVIYLGRTFYKHS
jgi:hypothetical protein